ncbi:hypothetical protein EG68_12407, partial [Paragonimus skrjabini miyazakii]
FQHISKFFCRHDYLRCEPRVSLDQDYRSHPLETFVHCSETLNKPPLRTIITETHVPKLQVRRSETLRRQNIHVDNGYQ